MKVYYVLLISLLFSSCNDLPETLEICGEIYPIEYAEIHLDDEDIPAKMAQVKDKNTKETMLGYFVEAKRNDTVFIYSEIRISGDYLIRKNNHYFNITSGLDSTVAIFKCSGNSLKIQSTKTYNDGVVIWSQTY